jgi:hypothetical protein
MRRLITILVLAVSINATAFEIHVSPTGNDRNPGTTAKPLATLEAARDLVRAKKSGGGATVILHEGRYFRSKTFELDERDSGTVGEPVVYRAAAGTKVFIDGGRVVPNADCKPVTDKTARGRLVPEMADRILQVDLKALGISDYGNVGPRGFARTVIPAPLELFINAEPQDVARWPNRGQANVPLGKVVDKGSTPRTGDYSMRGGVFKYGVKRAERWTGAKGWYVSGVFNYGFADDTIPVAELDTVAGTIRTTVPHLYGFTQRGFTKWFALNLMEEIDVPGEYCADPATGILYFLPPGDVKGALIQVSLLAEPFVAMERASHVVVEGVTFENARGSGVYIEEGTGNRIVGCTFRNLGIVGIQIGQGAAPLPDGRHDAHHIADKTKPASRLVGSYSNYIYANTAWNRKGGTHHLVVSCDIYNTGGGGIILGGGDRKTLTPAGNRAENCDIFRVNRWDRMYRTPINIDGVGNIVRHCHLHDCPGQAVLLHGNDHLFEYNEIDHVLTGMSDQGAVYMGRDPSESGTVFRHNFFHDVTNPHAGGHANSAFFFDDCCTYGISIVGNVFFRLGSAGVIRFNGGGESPLINNIFVRSKAPKDNRAPVARNHKRTVEYFKSELGLERCFRAVDIRKPPYLAKYPILNAIATEARTLTQPAERNFHADSLLGMFINPERMDFRLKDGKRIASIVPGFEPIPFGRIGLRVDAYRAAMPVSSPVATPPSQVFLKSVEVKLAPSAADAARDDVVVRYTTDGSDPDETDAVAREALILNDTTRVKVRTFVTSKTWVRPSPVVSVLYKKTDELHLSLIPEVEASAHQGLKKNINYAGSGPVSLGGKTFSSSLMTCPALPARRAQVTYALSGPLVGVKRFLAEVGVDDAMTGSGSVVFVVELKREGKWSQVFKSSTLRGGRGSKSIDVDIAGAEVLRLVTTDAGDNIHADHAVWGGARVE